jgi:hypothetical protein
MAKVEYLVHLDLAKNELQNAVIQNLGTAPSTPVGGQIYYDTTDGNIYVWDGIGTAWVDLTSQGSGSTNLGWTPSPTTGTVTSSTGTNAILTLATGTNSGLMAPAHYTLVANIIAGTDYGDITTSADGATWTIDAGVVTLAKMADIATGTFIGRNTAATGVPEVLTIATAKTMLDLTGTNSGDQTITLTSDVTGTGTGSFATTIASNVVTYAKMQQASVGYTIMGKATTGAGNYAQITAGTDSVLRRSASGDLGFGTLVTNHLGANIVTYAKIQTMATQTFLGRTTAATGNVEALTIAQVKTMLNLTGTNSGDQTITLTGDVTGTGTGSFATTIAASSIDWAMLNQAWVITQAEGIAANDTDVTIPTSAAVKDYVDNAVTGSLVYQGGYNASTDTPSLDDGTPIAGILKGHTYTVTTAGDFFTEAVEAGDMLIAEIDSPTVLADWTTVNKNIPDLGATGAEGSVIRRKSGTCDADTSTTITHNFNTRNVTVMVYRTGTPWDVVVPEIKMTTVNTVDVNFNTAPTLAEYTIVVMG